MKSDRDWRLEMMLLTSVGGAVDVWRRLSTGNGSVDAPGAVDMRKQNRELQNEIEL